MFSKSSFLRLVLLVCLFFLSSSAPSSSSSGAGDGLSFALLGDWGFPGPQQSAVSSALTVADAADPYDFILSLGDNFYQSGVASTSDKQWTETWIDVYSALLTKRTVFYTILGNHDYGQVPSPAAQKDFKYNDLWAMPDYQYVKFFSTCDGVEVDREKYEPNSCPSGLTALVFIDTPVMVPGESSDVYDTLLALFGDDAGVQAKVEEYFLWTESTLSNLSSDDSVSWLLVAGHYPIYTTGGHGDYSDPGNAGGPCAIVSLKERLLPLLREYGVDAYLSGHDHILTYLRSDDPENATPEEEVTLVVSGSGAKLDSIQYPEVDGATIPFNAGKPGFMSVSISGCDMRLSVTAFDVDSAGKVANSEAAVVFEATQRAKRGERFGCGPWVPPSLGKQSEEEEKGKASRSDAAAIVFICLVLVACAAFVLAALSRLEDKSKKETEEKKKSAQLLPGGRGGETTNPVWRKSKAEDEERESLW